MQRRRGGKTASSKKKGKTARTPYHIYAGQLPTSIDNIKIVSFDPAPTHPAISICTRDGTRRTTIALEMAEFKRVKGATIIPTYQQLNELFMKYYPYMRDAKLFIVEETPTKNWETLRAMQHAISWFSVYMPECCIVEIRNTLRLTTFNIPFGLDTDELKHTIILTAEHITRYRGDNQPNALIHKYLSVIEEQKTLGKKVRRPFRIHDQCDTIVQEEAFLQFLKFVTPLPRS
jgi:hypothetical protein